MSIKLTWKDNTTIETRYEVWSIDPLTNDRTLVEVVPGTESKGGMFEWFGTGEYACGQHTFDVAAVSPSEQYAWLDQPITITLPCDENIVVCQRFETNLGNSAPAAAEITAVYNLTTFTSGVVPTVKDTYSSSVYFRGDSTVEYFNQGPDLRKFYFSPLVNLNPPETNKDFTVEGWFRFDEFNHTLNENGGVIFTGSRPDEAVPHPSIEGGVYYTPGDANGDKVAKIYFKTYAGVGSGNLQEYITDAVVKPLEWVHIAWVKEQDKLHIYVDGELHQSFNFTGLNVAPVGTTNGMRIGTGTAAYVNLNPGMGFKGNMLDFRIINGQAITICPDVFPLPLCETGAPLDEDKKVQNEYVHLDSCTGIDTTTGIWTDGSGENPFRFFGGSSSVVVHNDAQDCPCYAEINTVLKGPSTSTFQTIDTFSFASWFKSDTTIQSGSNERSLLDYTHKVGNAKYGFKVVLSSTEGGKTGTLDLVVGTGLDGDWVTYSSWKDTWAADRWYHVLIVHHGTMITMYVNGGFQKGITNVVGINSHSEDVTIGDGWNGALNLSTWEFYKNRILNGQEIEDSYDPKVMIDTTDPCPGSSPCTIDRVYTDFSDWGDFHGTWSQGGAWTLISQHDSTHPGWNNSKLDGTGNPVNPHIQINANNSITFDPEFHYGSNHNRVYAFHPELHNLNSGVNSWCITASIQGSAVGEIAVQPVILQDGKMFMSGSLGSTGLQVGGNTITDQFVENMREVNNVVPDLNAPLVNLRKPFQIGIAMSNSILNTTGTLTRYEVCIKSLGKKCLPPVVEPVDPSCIDLKLHLSYDHIETGLDYIEDSSKYNRLVQTNNSTTSSMDNFTGETKQLYTLDDVTVDINDDFRITNTDKICVDGWLKVPTGANAYYLVKKVENNWVKSALTPLVYNGHDWYIHVNPSSKYIEFAHGEQRHRVVDIETDVWFHFAFLQDQGFKSIFINGTETAVEVFDNIPAETPESSMILNGLVDDLRIVKGSTVYKDSFFPPAKYTTTACRDETPNQACVRVANDEIFNTWTIQNNKSHDAVSVIEKYNREAAIVKTVSGDINYVGLVREDVVAFDFPLDDARELKLSVDVKMLNLGTSSGSDLYFIINQNNTWFYYYAGTTGTSDISTTKDYTIDVSDPTYDWTPVHKVGTDTLDLTGATQISLGFGVSNSDNGTVELEITRASLEIVGQRCAAVLTPDQPICDDIVLHLATDNQTTGSTDILDFSPYGGDVTSTDVEYSTDTTKWSNNSLEFTSLSSTLKTADNDHVDINTSPFTVEFWANAKDNQSCKYLYSVDDGDKFSSYLNNNVLTVTVADKTIDVQIDHTYHNQWHHYAMVGTGQDLLIFVDGELKTETSYQPEQITGDFYVGSHQTNDPLSGYQGYMEDFRLTVGTAIYNTKFLPPVKLPIYLSDYTVPSDCSTTLLHLQSINFPTGSNVITDASGKNNQLVHTNTVHDDQPVLNTTSSFKFISSSSVTVVGETLTTFDILSGDDFTIESWIKPDFSGSKINLGGGDRGWGIFTTLNDVNDDGYMLFLTDTGRLGYKAGTDAEDIHITSSPGLITADKWYHVSVTRQDSLIVLYLNGKSVSGKYFPRKITTTTPIKVANAFASTTTGSFVGHMNDIRFIVGHSVYNNCGSTVPDTLITRCSDIVDPMPPECEQVLGHIQVGALGITDDVIDLSKHSHTIDSLTTPKFDIQNIGSDWYVSAGSGAGQIISPVIHSSSNLGDAFTIETVLRCASLPVDDSYLIYNPEFNLRLNRDKLIFTANGTTIEYDHSSLTLQDLQNHHVAIVRSGKGIGQTTMYIDGEPVTTGTYTADVEIGDISGNPGYMIGGTPASSNAAPNLLLNDIRVTTGHAVYMGKFLKPGSLPTLRFNVEEPVIDNIKFFLQTEGNNGSTTFTDISRSSHTVLSDEDSITHSTDDKKWGNTSAKFPGTGVLLLPRLGNLESDFIDIRNKDFTYEMWIKPTVVNVEQTLISMDKKQSLESNSDAYGHDAIKIDITSTNAIRCQIRSKGAGNPLDITDGTNSGTGVMLTRDDVIKVNEWQHVAWSRENGYFRVYINGSNVSTSQSDTSTGGVVRWPWEPMRRDSEGNELNIIIGGTREDSTFTGYIDGVRYVKDEAMYTKCSYVVPDDKSPLDKVLPVNPDCEDVLSHIQTDALYGVADFSGKENVVTLTGTDQSLDQFVLNGTMSIPLSSDNTSAASVEVTNDNIPIDMSGPISFYEMWIKPPITGSTSNLRVFTMKDASNTASVQVLVNDTIVTLLYRAVGASGSTWFGPINYTLPANDWFHLAIKLENQKYINYINGEYQGTVNITGVIPPTTHYTLGGVPTSALPSPTAYIDDVRLSKTAVFPSTSTIYTQRLPRCESSPGGCDDIPGGYDKLKVCMSFESATNEDMSRYSHQVAPPNGNTNAGVVFDTAYQTYEEDGETKQFHSGFHGQHYHSFQDSNGLVITSSDHLIIGDQDFAIEMHIPPVIDNELVDVDTKTTLYEQYSPSGDGVSIYIECDTNGNVILCANLVSGSNNLTLKSHTPGSNPNYDFSDTTRGPANQRIMLSRADGVVRLYGYYNDNENQASVLKSDTFAHNISNSGDIKLGHGFHDDWTGHMDSIRITVGSIIGDCPYFSKKTCIKCEGFTGDVDAVKYICAVARSIGIQPVDIEYDKLYEVNKFVVTGKNDGWWNKIHALYLPIWQDPLANAINAKSPGIYNLDEDWKFNQDSGEWVHDSGPYTQLTNYNENENGNGITTPFTNNQLSWAADDCSVGVYLKDMPLDKNNYVMSTNNSTGINVDTRSRCNKSSGFTLMTTDSQRVKTYVNGTMTVNNAGVTQMQGVSENNKWVIGGTNWAGSGNMASGINDIKIQGIYFGNGLTQVESKSISSSMVKVIQTFDYDDKNPSDVIDEDYLTNKALFAVLYRSGYTYTNPSWIRERTAMTGLTPDSIVHHDAYQPLKNYYTTDKSWLDKIKALYLPMWKDSNVNRINFACPWLYDIESWNTRSPFWRLGGGSLTNPPTVNNVSILPAPHAMYSADSISADNESAMTLWVDDTGNSRDLTYDSSDHDNLATEPTGPQFLTTGGLGRNEKCVLFGYNGSRTPGQEHLYVAGRTGNAFRMVVNNGLPQPTTTYKHIFVVYRNITAVNNSTPISLDSNTQIFTQYDATQGESLTQSGFGTATVNGYRGSYWKNDGNGVLTWTPDPKTIWPDGSVNNPAGTPLLSETRFGKRIIHYQPNYGDNVPQQSVLCLGDLDNNNPLSIHGEYYDVVVYDQNLTDEQVFAVYNYLASKHNVSLHDDMLHNDYSGSVEHGHGAFTYIPSNNALPGDTNLNTQGTLTTFEGTDIDEVYQNEYISITNTSGGFGSVKYARDYCGSDTDLEVSMGNDVEQGWALGSKTNSFSKINAGLGVNPGFAYISHETNTNDLYTIDLTIAADSYNRTSALIPVKSPALFALNNNGDTQMGSQDKYQAFFFTDDLTSNNQLSAFGNSINSITNSIPDSVGTTCSVTYVSDPDAQAYICAVVNAGGLLSSEAANDIRVSAINDFVTRGKSQGWWGKIKALYLPIWQCSEANKINMITPGVKSMILDDSKLDHESGKYLRLLGTGNDTETSNEIILPYKPKDIYRSTCENHDPRSPELYTQNITTYLRNFNINTGTNPLMWGFMYNDLTNSQPAQIYNNDPYNPDVSRDDLLLMEWPGRGTTFTSGPTNQSFNGPLNTMIHDREVTGGLLSENIIGSSHSEMSFNDKSSRSTTNTGLSGLKDYGGTGHRDYVIPQYYLNMPLGGSENTCISYIALGIGFNVDTELAIFNDYKEAVEELVGFTDSKLNAYTYPTIGSDILKLHGIKSAGSRGSVVTLTSVKQQTTAYDINVPQSQSTISSPLTSVWDDTRVWNYKLDNYSIEIWDPSYENSTNHHQIRPDGRSLSHTIGNGASTANAVALGYAVRRPEGGLGIRETLRGDYYYSPGDPESQTYIRGIQSGAVRRSTYSRAGYQYNDNSANNEDRMLKFKILPSSPDKGLFVGGGSSRSADTSNSSSSDSSAADLSRGLRTSPDLFNKYPSNNIPFTVGEPVEIMYVDGSFCPSEHGTWQSNAWYDNTDLMYNAKRSIGTTPIRSNVEYYNKRYKVAELTDLNGNGLSDGDVFDEGTTHGGPEPKPTLGASVSLKAWMRLEMEDITSIDIGPTDNHDLVLTSTLSATDASRAHEWTSRFYFHDSDTPGSIFNYNLEVDQNSDIYVGGTYSDYAIVNYDMSLDKKYSIRLDCEGNETDSATQNPNGYTQAFMMKINPDTGEVENFRSTGGECRSECLGTTTDSTGNLYMVGSVSGKVKFTDNHGMFRSMNRGVNTTSLTNKYGFIAKSSMNHTALDKFAIYRPLDYTWEWVNYVDSPGELENQNRVVSDITVDGYDDVYVVGYYDCPSEIGRSGAASRLSDTPQFEPGYHWDDNNNLTVFVSKYDTNGKCKWTKTTTIGSQINDTQKIHVHDNEVYVMNNASDISFGTTSLSGVCIDSFDCGTGDYINSKNINTDSTISGNDFNISDNSVISIVGEFSGTVTSDTVTLIDTQTSLDSSNPDGFFAMLPIGMLTGRVGSFSSTGQNSTCAGTTMDYSIGHNVIMGVSTGDTAATLGPVSQTTTKPTNHNTYTFTISHEL